MYIIWAIIGFIFLYADFKKSGIYKLSLACAFLFTSITAYKIPQNYTIQISALLCFCAIFYFLIKTIFIKEFQDVKKLKNAENILQKTATVTKDIGKTLSIDGIGQIKINNELWSAKAVNDKEIKAGRKVKIVSRENMVLNVEVIK